MKKIILTAKAPAPIGPYSQAVMAGNTLYCSGQIPIDPATGQVFTGDIKGQAELVMKNIGLKRGGCWFSKYREDHNLFNFDE